MELFKIGFLSITAVDLLDILIIAFVLYQLFKLLKGTRAAPMLVGLLTIIIFLLFAQWVGMSGLSWLFLSLKTVWIISFVILFQPELRRILVRVGQNRFFRLFYKSTEAQLLNEIVNVTRVLSKRGYGALIVLIKDIGLDSIIETGVQLEAKASTPLLESIFAPKSPLHDGAVVMQGGIIVAAKCILPLSESPMATSLGTRHRAALGLSEESDAVVVVVSEENQAISLATRGNLYRNLKPEELNTHLSRLLRES